ncbi:MAG: FHA domain-containing protein [Microbacterium sp.]|uniref:FHA domain-containing protein n=1 Tax=Microbacterium sp. TaxID=51671 RepID=UPI0039E525A0
MTHEFGIISSIPDFGASSPADGPVEVDETVAAPTPRAVLSWDDSTRVAVYGRTLFGRNPAAEHGAVCVPVRDETLSLSKTHFEIDADDTAVWVVDRHSTNGTALVRDGVRTLLPAGERAILRVGDRLEFGDRAATVGRVS